MVASAPTNDPRVRDMEERLYASLGAQVTVRHHEERTRIDQPFEYVNELLIRPSDFSVTRVRPWPDAGERAEDLALAAGDYAADLGVFPETPRR